jgi:hypothetical protein
MGLTRRNGESLVPGCETNGTVSEPAPDSPTLWVWQRLAAFICRADTPACFFHGLFSMLFSGFHDGWSQVKPMPAPRKKREAEA